MAKKDKKSDKVKAKAKADKSKKKPKKTGPVIEDDSVWVLGTHMTRFGRYPDQDAVDLASTSAIAALQDGGVTIHDMDVFAAGTLFQASSGMAQQVQKQIGQTGIEGAAGIIERRSGARQLRLGVASFSVERL